METRGSTPSPRAIAGYAIALELAVAARPPAAADFAVSSIDAVTETDRPGALRVVVSNEGKVRGTAPIVLRRDGVVIRSVLALAHRVR